MALSAVFLRHVYKKQIAPLYAPGVQAPSAENKDGCYMKNRSGHPCEKRGRCIVPAFLSRKEKGSLPLSFPQVSHGTWPENRGLQFPGGACMIKDKPI